MNTVHAKCLWTVAFALALTLTCVSSDAEKRGSTPLTVLRGLSEGPLFDTLEGLSVLMWHGSRPPASETVLRSRARRHRERLLQALHSEGYYDGAIDFDVVWSEERPQVVFTITPGAPYRISKVTLLFRESTDEHAAAAPTPETDFALKLDVGDVARSESILAAERRIQQQLQDDGHPFADVYSRRVTVNHPEGTVAVTCFVAPGPALGFGEVTVAGLDEVRLEAVLREMRWREGDPYRITLVDETRERLQRTGLFSVVRVEPGLMDRAEHGRIPMEIEVTERRHRTISLGLQYRTDEGIGAGGQWEHRNFLGLGRRLRVQSQLTELEQSLGTTYEIQQFRRPDQTLTLHVKAAQLDPDPYQSRRVDVGAWVERTLSPEWQVGMGPALRLSRVDERRRSRQYYLASFPMQVSWDRRDDRMDPTRGFRITERLTPFVDFTSVDTQFLKNELTLTHFLPASFMPTLVLATRLRLGIMGGASLSEIPADERFYGGGGGSIRGYAYQKVGPLDEYGDPSGGRSLTDWTLELRKRINQQFGVVAFVDGGMAHETAYPDFKHDVQWGAGLGFRYFTPIGPLRLDVAVPVNRRKGMDSSMQFYISIGQAF